MRPIRKLLLRELLVLIGPLVLVFLGVTWAGTARILDNQLEARSRESLETMVREVRTQLAEAEQAARTVEAWWQRGRLSLAQPGEAVHLVRPFMEGSPNLAEILLVTPDGMGLSVRRISDGRVRSSRFVAEGSGTRYTPLPDPQAPNVRPRRPRPGRPARRRRRAPRGPSRSGRPAAPPKPRRRARGDRKSVV